MRYNRLMQDKQSLLNILNQPGFHSGTTMGEVLGISRVAVKKRIETLIKEGLPVHSVHGRGYCLDKDVVLLDEQQIIDNLPKQFKQYMHSIEVHQSLPSTNSYLLSKEIISGMARVCVAEAQPSGKGRRGNVWDSLPYRNVMLSLSWAFDDWPETITGLGLAASVSIAKCLQKKYGIDISIKWPNDLLVDNKKIAGVLIEVNGESGGRCNLVMGLGLNVYQANQGKLAQQEHSTVHNKKADYEWVDMYRLGCVVNRNQLVADCITAWLQMLLEFSQSGFTSFVDDWNALSSYHDKQIKVQSTREIIVGTMRGVDNYGALLVEAENAQTVRFTETDVSVRLL